MVESHVSCCVSDISLLIMQRQRDVKGRGSSPFLCGKEGRRDPWGVPTLLEGVILDCVD